MLHGPRTDLEHFRVPSAVEKSCADNWVAVTTNAIRDITSATSAVISEVSSIIYMFVKVLKKVTGNDRTFKTDSFFNERHIRDATMEILKEMATTRL